MWKNIAELDRPQITIWHMHTACWITKAIDTLRIRNTYGFSTATTVKQPASVLRYMYITCLLTSFLVNAQSEI